jgi:YidC/Oxa1 family membrane protein insertase
VEAATADRVTFTYEEASGLAVRKEFRFEPEPYLLGVELSVRMGGETVIPSMQWGPALGPLTTGTQSRYLQTSEGILYLDGDVERLSASDISNRSTYAGTIGFGGVDDQYFLAALIRPGAVTFAYQPVTLPALAPEGTPNQLVAYDALPDAAGPLRVFAGPKDFDVLRAIDPDLVRAINFGWFAWLVVPLLTALKWLNGFIGNYGWSIIALTVMINAAMFPLRHKSVVSMRKMQEIQPEIKAIQERYAKLKATDPAKQKMNTEMMALYRERGVNPASGCIPMLLTMPVLFAFYSLLSVAVELRGAPFVGWIGDLSAPDPLYITPVIMGATMVVQQRMTPSTMDPMQQKIMMVMPVVFTFMFLQAPSGLVLYWLVSNLWAIGQQHITNRIIGPPAVRHLRPAAERKLKKAGAGKSEAAAEKS